MTKKIFTILCLTIISLASQAAELSIAFNIKNLDPRDAHLKITMESTNPVCSKIAVGIGGVAVGRRYKFLSGLLKLNNEKLIAISDYQEGGFCQYKISEIYLYFLNQKNAYFETKVSILSKAQWFGGALDKTELSTNQNSKIEVTCVGKKTHSLSNCVTKSNDVPNSRSNSGHLYIWRENLREFDAYYGGTLKFISE